MVILSERKESMADNQKRVKIEATLLLPEGLSSSGIIAAIAEALEGLPGGERIKIEKLKYDPG